MKAGRSGPAQTIEDTRQTTNLSPSIAALAGAAF